jgi:serine/threonine protein phosphatase 1
VTARVLVWGDIHGCDLALETILDRIAVTRDDTLVFLGDAVDRGPASRQVLEKIVELRRAFNVVFVLGNHEEMLLDAIAGRGMDRWLRFGGAATLRSYGGTLSQFPEDHLELLNCAVAYWEDHTNICVHANLEPGVELSQQQPDWLRWQSLTGMEFPHPSGKRVLCGHSGIPGGLPSVGAGWVCLDTLAYKGGFLTCLDTVSGAIFQAQQSGSYRSGITLRDLEH